MIRPLVLQGGDYDVARRDDLRSELARNEPRADVVLDLAATDFLDCSCFGVLVTQLRAWRKDDRDCKFRLRNVAPSIVRMIDVLQLGRILIVETVRAPH